MVESSNRRRHSVEHNVTCIKQCFCCCERHRDEESSGDEVEDQSAKRLSHVGTAAYKVLSRHHNWSHQSQWNVTSGRVVGEVHQTPRTGWKADVDPSPGNDDWLPRKMGEIVSRTRFWCDVLSLGPPDGQFMVEMKKGLAAIAERSRRRASPSQDAEGGGSDDTKPVVVRLLFGNIVGMPVNCDSVIEQLTKDFPKDANVHLWVGAWRKGVSWNHAKIIAVDGQYLHTGGHNLWDYHYLRKNPVHDLSIELEGRIAHDGHMFANDQWWFIELNQRTHCGQIVNMLPDKLPMLMKTRVTISEYPVGKAEVYAPKYNKSLAPTREPVEGRVPVISLGRYGSPVPIKRPSDDAFVAMISSARSVIRLALQDLGPVCVPGTKVGLPGCTWPRVYLRELGRAIWERSVDVEIALSNPNSIPGDLSPAEANYGNGWSCVDVAAEIIKTIRDQFPSAKDGELRQKVAQNLRVCFIREARGSAWEDGKTMGMHSKHFIVDDLAVYIGSQNLYVCDLAEWGVLIDNEEATKKIMDEYWHPMWESSYTGEDCDVQSVMDGLKIDREAPPVRNPLHRQSIMFAAARQQAATPGKAAADMYTTDPHEAHRRQSALDHARQSVANSATVAAAAAAAAVSVPQTIDEREEDLEETKTKEKEEEGSC